MKYIKTWLMRVGLKMGVHEILMFKLHFYLEYTTPGIQRTEQTEEQFKPNRVQDERYCV